MDDHVPLEADYASILPNAQRVGDRTVRHLGPDPVTAWRGFVAGVRLAGVVD